MPKEKKILFIQPGYAHYRKKLFDILSERHDITFLFERSSNTYPGKIEAGGISHFFLDRLYSNCWSGLAHCLIKKKPDIVISSVSSSLRSWIAYVYTILFKKEFILWIVEWRPPTYSPRLINRLWRSLKNMAGTKLIRSCHALVVGGSASQKYALSLGKNERDIFVAIQCANDLKKHSGTNISVKTPREKKFTFLYMSRIIPCKGLDILISAFSKLRSKRADVSLIVVGDGPFRPYCQKLAESLKVDDISFVGPVNPQSVDALYQQADVFILPGHFNDVVYESWGLVINEAMSMGLPIITTPAVGAAYDLIIHGYNGLIVQEGSVEHLCNAMERIIGLDCFNMGNNSRLLFDQKNDFTQMANGFTSAIQHATARDKLR